MHSDITVRNLRVGKPNGSCLALLNLLLHLFRQTFKNEIVRMIDHVAKLFTGKAAIGPDGVPVLFVHVVAGPYFGVTLANFAGWFLVGLSS